MKNLILFLFVSTLSWGQNATRQFVSVEKSTSGYKVVVSDGVYYFSAYSEKMVETTFIPNGQKHPVNSHAVVASVATDMLQLSQSTGVVRLTTSAGLKVNIQQKPFQNLKKTA